MYDSSWLIQIVNKNVLKPILESSRHKLPEGMTYENLCMADADTKRKYRWPTIRQQRWVSRYGFPPIILLIGNNEQTDSLIGSLKQFVQEQGADIEFKSMSMQECIANNNKPLDTPKGKDGGFLLLSYQSELTDSSVYDLTSHILMVKNTDEESVYEGWQEDQNWLKEECHKDENHIMPWIRSGWFLIVIADESHYNPAMDYSKGFDSKIYVDLADHNKWYEIRAFEKDK